MGFEPIAVVGRGCVFPDALDPDTLWENVAAGRVAVAPVPERRWRVADQHITGPVDVCADATWTRMGGYVRGFDDVFDPAGFRLPGAEVGAFDPMVRWVLHGARQALGEAGYELHDEARTARAGLVLGNLNYPSDIAADFAEHVYVDGQTAGVRDRLLPALGPRPSGRGAFHTGLPAHLAARALGLGAGAFALDAACASYIHAVKLACDRLHDGSADLMLAGAVNCTDNLFIQIGFCALGAMSRSGRCRPFDRRADGLVPAEGAGFTALMRLRDAFAEGRPVLGVVRGVGLSNDGRGNGFASPSADGQEWAMRAAYAAAGLDPASISLLECHGTGTPVGDTTEVRSSARVFADHPGLPFGSVKANLGHPLAAAGAAGMLKLLGALRGGTRPATPGLTEPIDAVRGTPLRPLTEPLPWSGPRRAGLSAFGFGGTNAHLVLEAADTERALVAPPPPRPVPEPIDHRVAVVALGARVAGGRGLDDFRRTLLAGDAVADTRARIEVVLPGLSFPPRDLDDVQPHHLLVLEAAREATAGVRLPHERTAVLVGAGAAASLTRYGGRWRVPSWLAAAGVHADGDELGRYRDAFTPALTATRVLGTLPNLVAGRINAVLDLRGPGYAVCAEEASGVVALHLAVRALRSGEMDAAVVGAVDLSHDPVHQEALRAVGHDTPPGDAAVVMVLKRVTDARRDGDPVLAIVGDEHADGGPPGPGAPPKSDDLLVRGGDATEAAALPTALPPGFDPAALFGTAHAAQGLLSAAAAVVALGHRVRPRADGPAEPDPTLRTATVVVPTLGAPPARVRLTAGDPTPWLPEGPRRLSVYSGADRDEVVAALAEGREDGRGPARLALAGPAASAARRGAAARRWLTGAGGRPPGAAYRAAPVEGETAFVYTGGSAHYPGAGRELALAFPAEHVEVRRAHGLPATAPSGVLGQIFGVTALAALHTRLTRDTLGLLPQAAIGYSSGESTALVALGAWPDAAALYADACAGELFTRDVTGEHRAARTVWQRLGITGRRWATHVVNAPVNEVRAALGGRHAVHLMAVNTPDVCVIGGEADACAAVLEGPLRRAHTVRVDYDMAAHAPELEEVREQWWRLHHRPTVAVPGVRFYGCAAKESYVPTARLAADAVTAQAMGTIDFAAVIERAYADGVRVFVEHGPRGSCTGWIQRILGDRDHLAVAWDEAGTHGIDQLCQAVAEFAAAGVPCAAQSLFERLTAAAPPPADSPRVTRLIPYGAPIVLPASPVGGLPVSGAAGAFQSPARSALSEAARSLARQRELVVAAHRDHLAHATRAHEEFLTSRTRDLAALIAAARAAAAAGPAGTAGAAGVASPHHTVALPRRPEPDPYPAPAFDRAQLERHATGRISDLFGPLFAPQDGRVRQTRLPAPPLLLIDRVLGIAAEPASLATGTIWTETTVRNDSWYVDSAGRMPVGLMIEAGQADMLLMSYLGADLAGQGDRVYRLLGCEADFHGAAPRPGDTLRYEIHVTGTTEHNGIRIFFFRYDCYVGDELRLRVREGQAGYFTDAELADGDGVRWDPADHVPPEPIRHDPPVVDQVAARFGHEQVRAFAEGRPADCFGPGWERTHAHVRPPGIDSGRLRLLHEVTALDPAGGPWQRGYLRAETPIAGDEWFFDGHFHHDPCMPGTLMFQAGVQAMAFYLAALGHTADRDGWRFEPVPGRTTRMRCRGQATPASRLVTYELFVRETHAGPHPELRADMLVTVDGVKAFHAADVGVRLVPDWPLTHWRELGPPVARTTGEHVPPRLLGGLVGHRETRQVAESGGVSYGYPALLACAWGRPSEAFGPAVAALDDGRPLPRLPGPPYHFVSRVVSIEGPQHTLREGSGVRAEYDVPDRTWYFEQNGTATMPFAVLLEVALQPCGWLAMYGLGNALADGPPLAFRNLDGTATVHRAVDPGARTLHTHAELTGVSRYGDMILTAFTVRCLADGEPLADLRTSFGFFPSEALARQLGLPATEAERARLAAPSDVTFALGSDRPAPAGPMLRMLDRVTGYWPDGGPHGQGRLRAEKLIDPGAWYFGAHFFQDPVQPGSLGIEAMSQLLRFHIEERCAETLPEGTRFEPILTGRETTWKYRGQVVPTDRLLTVEMDVLSFTRDPGSTTAVAEAWLWIDGRRIYHVRDLGMRAVYPK